MSCLFISIGKLIGQPHTIVRKNICDYMVSHLDMHHQGMRLKEWIQWQTPNGNVLEYIQNMRAHHVWGGAMEIAVATQLYQCDIIVFNSRKQPLAEFLWKDRCMCRTRLYIEWNGSHYEPISKHNL